MGAFQRHSSRIQHELEGEVRPTHGRLTLDEVVVVKTVWISQFTGYCPLFDVFDQQNKVFGVSRDLFRDTGAVCSSVQPAFVNSE